MEDRNTNGASPAPNWDDLAVGQEVAVNAFTNYDTLAELVKKYNERVASTQPRLDGQIVELRNAIAHGRVSTSNPSEDMFLLKFDKPRRGRVKVVYSERMDLCWFEKQIRLVSGEVRKVTQAAGQLDVRIFPDDLAGPRT